MFRAQEFRSLMIIIDNFATRVFRKIKRTLDDAIIT